MRSFNTARLKLIGYFSIVVCISVLNSAAQDRALNQGTDTTNRNQQLEQGQDVFYYRKGKKVALKVDATKSYVLLTADTERASLDENTKSANSVLRQFAEVKPLKSLNLAESVDEQAKPLKWAIIEGIPENAVTFGQDEMQSKVVYQTPFFTTPKGKPVGVSHLVYVKLKREQDEATLKELANAIKVTIIGNNKLMPLWYTLSCTRDSGNALKVANRLYESGQFEVAEPDFLADYNIQCANDAHFAKQWGLNNTGQGGGATGIDIAICDAWNTSTGKGINVAVLDHGIELNHPDLPNMSSNSYDTVTGSSPSVVRGNHGTACGGIVGAARNNGSTGVVGVAPDATMISISDALTLGPNAQQNMANGLSWAWQNGADVISNSWGHDLLASSLIDDAINDALTKGRGGKGCVVVFAAGNANGAVIYPGNSNPSILTVGAMSPCGERKSPLSCDPETFWGSCFGDELDIVAPGVLIPTTDRQGAAGYDSGDYAFKFNGTSSATPHVAGVAALILAVYPDFNQSDVVQIIEENARKVGSYNYQSNAARPNGKWHQEMGYGLIDAEKCVLAAKAECGPTQNQLAGKPTPMALGLKSATLQNQGTVSDASASTVLASNSSDVTGEEETEGKEQFFQIVASAKGFTVKEAEEPAATVNAVADGISAVQAESQVVVISSEVTTKGTGHFPNWNRHSKTSGWSTVTTPSGYVFVKDSIEKKYLSRNGSSNRIDHEWDNYVEVIPGTGIKMPRTLRVRTHARSPERCGGCRGWTKARITARYVSYQQ